MADISPEPGPEAAVDATASLVRSVRRVAQAIDVRSREISRLTGLTLPQLLVLQSIRALGEVSTSAISRDVSMSAPTVVAVLDKLEAKGMAARYRSTVDRRVVHVRLTDAGRQALQTSPGLLGDGFLAALAELPHSERLAMAEAVERLAVLMQPRSRFTEIPRELPDIGMPSPAFPPTRRD
ncbi:MarR family winged helix-turn-helix transcriptional regulator [Brevundimonas sp. SPF441]|uniref:MarR family winged helix-turn-helix transcriptional regulator n=1 Tax=Brevundimonas sp. SPF441 TaxID=2663795 RepID=UPI00129ED853|nr:MarR family transcriptional regulator [Brevundimonas sp. SPF441]MRL68517.1 MarR family transcriptional regulator [Brevundimonas sp. SPF441]